MLEKIQFLFRVCATCSGFPVFNNSKLCARCWCKVTNYFSSAGTVVLEPGLARFGFSWSRISDGENKARLLHSMKGKSCRLSWRRLAEEFVIQHFEEIHKQRWIFIPAPPAAEGQADHARLWAEALAEAINGHAVSVLRRVKAGREQKDLDRSERRATQIEVMDPKSRLWVKSRIRKGWHVAFVDDVVTTGATAKAAWLALGRPKPYQVWALSYRSLER